jgi:hypothetical protein
MNAIEIYQSTDHQIEVRVQFEEDTVWLNQRQMAKLFDKDSDTIGLHLKNIFNEKELIETSTTEYFSVVQKGGKRIDKSQRTFGARKACWPMGFKVSNPY